MNDWKKYKLGDIMEVKHGFAFKGEFFIDEPTDDILLTPGNFRIGGGFKSDKFKYYTGDYPKEYILREGDILITMTDLSKEGDTLGYSARVPRHNNIRYLHNQRLGKVKLKSFEINENFLYWMLRTSKYHNFIVSSATGSTVKHTSPTRICNYEFYAPKDITEQSRIASILSSLDDKIELNLKMNKTLEAIAQAIFKEWFVDFRFPGFDGELVDGLPKGWKKGHLVEILDLQYGKALKSEDRKDGEYPVIGSNGVVGFHNDYYVNGPGIVIGRKGTIGKVVWIDQNFYPIDTTFFIMDTLGTSLLYYHFFLLQSQSFQKISSDSAVPGLNKNEALRNKVVVPTVEIVDRFNEFAKSLFERMTLLDNENQTLTILRDTLVPKLMTGKIRLQK